MPYTERRSAPRHWKELAKASKAQQLNVLQFAIDEMKSRCAEPSIQLVMNASLLKMVKNVFEMTDITSIAHGITSFLFYECLEAGGQCNMEHTHEQISRSNNSRSHIVAQGQG